MYANDCIAIKNRDKVRTLKRIEKHTDEELSAAVELASRKFGDDFWLLLHAIDAYMERRRRYRERRAKVRENRRQAFLDRIKHDIDNDELWGSS